MKKTIATASVIGFLAFGGNAMADRGFVTAVHNGTSGDCFTFELTYSGDKTHEDGTVQTFVVPMPDAQPDGWNRRNTIISVNGSYFGGGKTLIGLRPNGGSATCQGTTLPTFTAFSSPPIADQ